VVQIPQKTYTSVSIGCWANNEQTCLSKKSALVSNKITKDHATHHHHHHPISSFTHLSFIFSLKYPAPVSNNVSNVLFTTSIWNMIYSVCIDGTWDIFWACAERCLTIMSFLNFFVKGRVYWVLFSNHKKEKQIWFIEA
jgi:hypothetical protein